MTYRFDCWRARPNFATIVNFALAGYSAKFIADKINLSADSDIKILMVDSKDY